MQKKHMSKYTRLYDLDGFLYHLDNCNHDLYNMLICAKYNMT